MNWTAYIADLSKQYFIGTCMIVAVWQTKKQLYMVHGCASGCPSVNT